MPPNAPAPDGDGGEDGARGGAPGPQFVPSATTSPVSRGEAAQAPAVPQKATPTDVGPQVAMVLSPLRRGPDGVHRMTIQLRPEELGPVSIVAEVRGGAIAVQLQANHEAGRAALQAALPELRQDLRDAGFGDCALDLHQQTYAGGNQSQHFSGWQPEGRSQRRAPERAETAVAAEFAESVDGLLDLRI
jgi:flagellar hook-length control protein FliK